MKIPKIIHYCWFGKNEKPTLVKECIKSWDILEKQGYKIIEWNEKNFDISSNKYCETAYIEKKWAFVSDYVRLKVLYEYGGIYLDTDMQIIKPFDDFLENDMFLGFLVNCVLSTSIIASKPQHRLIKKLLDIYDNMDLEIKPNNDLLTKFILDEYPNFKLNNKYQIFKDVSIYPKEFFNDPTYKKDINYCVHKYLGSWREEAANGRSFKGKLLNKLIGDVFFYKLISYRLNKNSPFYTISKNQN